jgi:hypothetical protein
MIGFCAESFMQKDSPTQICSSDKLNWMQWNELYCSYISQCPVIGGQCQVVHKRACQFQLIYAIHKLWHIMISCENILVLVTIA